MENYPYEPCHNFFCCYSLTKADLFLTSCAKFVPGTMKLQKMTSQSKARRYR